ncbi:hypothetical protein GPECTOR_3g45 [Gonium pectorale]|uniref:DUF4211 domain-containing protein n=1 Tax=Gonium pectorale TaxID=33097 RepID=A0A150GZH3_GONPE|nr:hypothetical protein GPECTOR_3g45 [Gonium pectorale]|eukprot:KXZ55316.1 hypothetical protein GPECTOR_3g45 [Gonium pectorale]
MPLEGQADPEVDPELQDNSGSGDDDVVILDKGEDGPSGVRPRPPASRQRRRGRALDESDEDEGDSSEDGNAAYVAGPSRAGRAAAAKGRSAVERAHGVGNAAAAAGRQASGRLRRASVTPEPLGCVASAEEELEDDVGEGAAGAAGPAATPGSAKDIPGRSGGLRPPKQRQRLTVEELKRRAQRKLESVFEGDEPAAGLDAEGGTEDGDDDEEEDALAADLAAAARGGGAYGTGAATRARGGRERRRQRLPTHPGLQGEGGQDFEEAYFLDDHESEGEDAGCGPEPNHGRVRGGRGGGRREDEYDEDDSFIDDGEEEEQPPDERDWEEEQADEAEGGGAPPSPARAARCSAGAGGMGSPPVAPRTNSDDLEQFRLWVTRMLCELLHMQLGDGDENELARQRMDEDNAIRRFTEDLKSAKYEVQSFHWVKAATELGLLSSLERFPVLRIDGMPAHEFYGEEGARAVRERALAEDDYNMGDDGEPMHCTICNSHRTHRIHNITLGGMPMDESGTRLQEAGEQEEEDEEDEEQENEEPQGRRGRGRGRGVRQAAKRPKKPTRRFYAGGSCLDRVVLYHALCHFKRVLRSALKRRVKYVLERELRAYDAWQPGDVLPDETRGAAMLHVLENQKKFLEAIFCRYKDLLSAATRKQLSENSRKKDTFRPGAMVANIMWKLHWTEDGYEPDIRGVPTEGEDEEEEEEEEGDEGKEEGEEGDEEDHHGDGDGNNEVPEDREDLDPGPDGEGSLPSGRGVAAPADTRNGGGSGRDYHGKDDNGVPGADVGCSGAGARGPSAATARRRQTRIIESDDDEHETAAGSSGPGATAATVALLARRQPSAAPQSANASAGGAAANVLGAPSAEELRQATKRRRQEAAAAAAAEAARAAEAAAAAAATAAAAAVEAARAAAALANDSPSAPSARASSGARSRQTKITELLTPRRLQLEPQGRRAPSQPPASAGGSASAGAKNGTPPLEVVDLVDSSGDEGQEKSGRGVGCGAGAPETQAAMAAATQAASAGPCGAAVGDGLPDDGLPDDGLPGALTAEKGLGEGHGWAATQALGTQATQALGTASAAEPLPETVHEAAMKEETEEQADEEDGAGARLPAEEQSAHGAGPAALLPGWADEYTGPDRGAGVDPEPLECPAVKSEPVEGLGAGVTAEAEAEAGRFEAVKAEAASLEAQDRMEVDYD